MMRNLMPVVFLIVSLINVALSGAAHNAPAAIAWILVVMLVIGLYFLERD